VLNLRSGDSAEVRHDPFPLVILRPALDPEDYARLVEAFPSASDFSEVPNYPYKLGLGRNHGRAQFEKFTTTNPVWSRFRAAVESEAFIRDVVKFLGMNNIAPRVGRGLDGPRKRLARAIADVRQGRLPQIGPRLTSRFEFSVLRADGGEVTPHTDAPRKIITIVLAMIREGEWDPAWGGALDMNRTRDPRYAFNWHNRAVPWEAVEIVDTVPFLPNQALIFVKTHNSLHSVRRMTQTGSPALRKSVTIVIERDDEE
jgi:hypothetical protein